MEENTYTRIGEFITCNDCGAHALLLDEVIHHKTCTPGEAAKWEEYYGDIDELEDFLSDKEYEEYLRQNPSREEHAETENHP